MDSEITDATGKVSFTSSYTFNSTENHIIDSNFFADPCRSVCALYWNLYSIVPARV